MAYDDDGAEFDVEDYEYDRSDEGYVEDDEPPSQDDEEDNPLWDLDDEWADEDKHGPKNPPRRGRYDG